jgi:hypothetical protein
MNLFINFLKNIFHINFFLFLNITFFLLIFIFSKEWLVVNEEFLIGLSFLILFYLLQKFASDLIKIELDSIYLNLYDQYKNLYKIKFNIQKKLLFIYNKKYKFYRYLKLVTYGVEDELEIIGLRRSLITKESHSIYLNTLLVNFIIKYNLKLRIIYNEILFYTNKDLKED